MSAAVAQAPEVEMAHIHPAPASANSGTGDKSGAPLSLQVEALAKKNWHFQKRRKWTNCCLATLPIIFIAILAALQALINSILANSDELQCPKDKSDATPGQLAWCALEHPQTVVPLFLLPSRIFAADSLILTSGDNAQNIAQLNDGISAGQAVIDARAGAAWTSFTTTAYQAFNASCPASSGTPITLQAFQNALLSSCANYGNDVSEASNFINGSVVAQSISDAATYVSQSDAETCTRTAMSAASRLPLPNIPFGSPSRLGIRLFSDTAFSSLEVADTESLVDYEVETGPWSIVELMAANCSSLSAVSQCYSRLVGLATGARSACRSTNPTVVPTSDLRTKIFDSWIDRKTKAADTLKEISAAYEWQGSDSSSSTFRVSIYFNDTNQAENDGGGPPAMLRVSAPLSAAVTSWVDKVFNNHNYNGGYSNRLRGLKEMPKPETSLVLDFASLLGPLLYVWVVQLPFPVVLIALVYEKEFRLRVMMKMMGLRDQAYWIITYLYNAAIFFVYIVIFVALGSAAGLNIFTRNSMGIQFLFYFFFLNNQVALAFLSQNLFRSTRAATVVSYLWVIGSGVIANFVVSSFISSPATSPAVLTLLHLLPPFALYRGLFEFAEYAFQAGYNGTFGMDFDNLRDSANGTQEVIIILAVEWIVFMLLAVYLSQVIDSGAGVRKHPLFFLGYTRQSHKDVSSEYQAALSRMPEDVRLERERTLRDDATDAIKIRDLQKVYPGIAGQPAKHAVKTLTMGIKSGECFGMLGPNGAGKSTTISMLSGFVEATSGTATVQGLDINSQMEDIYTQMGVCPQHDLVWESLTGEEHLQFYGRLKKLRGQDLKEAVEKALQSVNLWDDTVRPKLVGQYSGGMKRRLSVAISLMGNPTAVYLDEPSTGLDPASRRQLWEAIKTAKQGRAIILTTHSMEEAEVLCDRLGIFVDGELRCVGYPKELTRRYGSHYVLSTTCEGRFQESVRQAVLQLSAESVCTYSVGDTMKFAVPLKAVSESKIFQAMQHLKSQDILRDWGVANASLEEVFIEIAKGKAKDQLSPKANSGIAANTSQQQLSENPNVIVA